ncbi:MAG: hypothetical protein ACRDNX_00600 [Gaiellaceae bacterium]
MRAPTPVLPFTRVVFAFGVCLTVATGPALLLAPHRTADYWAWTINASPTSAFFGAGYVGAAVALGAAARAPMWRQARVVAVVAFTLTSLALLETLLNLEPFAFGAGGLTEAVAWIWLAVYGVLPPLALTAYVLQERAGGAHEYDVEAPALRATRIALGAAGAALAVVGGALLADWEWLTARWPWPLSPLPAGVVGAWLCTYAAGFIWFSLRERKWSRIRLAALPAALAVALDLVSVVRLWESFDRGAATGIYVAALVALLVGLGATALVEERRLSRLRPRSQRRRDSNPR